MEAQPGSRRPRASADLSALRLAASAGTSGGLQEKRQNVFSSFFVPTASVEMWTEFSTWWQMASPQVSCVGCVGTGNGAGRCRPRTVTLLYAQCPRLGRMGLILFMAPHGCQWTCCLEGRFFFHLQIFIFCCFQLIIHNLKVLLCGENELSALTFHATMNCMKIWHLWVYISKCYKGKRNQALWEWLRENFAVAAALALCWSLQAVSASSGKPAQSYIPAQAELGHLLLWQDNTAPAS